MKILYSCFVLLLSINVCGQVASSYGEIIDERDGKKYQTIKIGDNVWIAENMKYETQNSENHDGENHQIKLNGYYYSFDEIKEVCPIGFRIPNDKEWNEYIELVLELKGLTEQEVVLFNKEKKGKALVGAIIFGNKFKPFEAPNPLKLNGYGHTQNGEIVALGSFNIWVTYESSKDPKYHVHLDSEGYSIHSHKHNIIDKKKKRRKFSAMCIKE